MSAMEQHKVAMEFVTEAVCDCVVAIDLVQG